MFDLKLPRDDGFTDRCRILIEDKTPIIIFTLDGIIGQVWGPEGGERDMLRQLIRRLRRKVEIDPAQPAYIGTVPGRGYGLMVPDE